MSRTLVGTTSSGVGAAVTAPGYFIEITWASSTGRYSTRGTLTWNSQTWTATDVRVSGLATDAGSPSIGGALRFGNADLAIGTLILSDGVAGRAIRIWAFYGDSNPGASDPVLLFDGIGDGAALDDVGSATIELAQSGGVTLYVPRLYMTQAAGFNWLPADGQIVEFNGERIRLTPEGF